MSSMKNRRPRRTPVFQINAKVFSRYSHPVKEKALHTVVSITALEEIVPSCPMLRAMLKQLTVVGELSISKTAVSTSPRQPSQTASGKNSTAKTNSLKIPLTTAGFQQPAAFFDTGAQRQKSQRRCCGGKAAHGTLHDDRLRNLEKGPEQADGNA